MNKSTCLLNGRLHSAKHRDRSVSVLLEHKYRLRKFFSKCKFSKTARYVTPALSVKNSILYLALDIIFVKRFES